MRSPLIATTEQHLLTTTRDSLWAATKIQHRQKKKKILRTEAKALRPCLFNLYAKYIMRNARLDEAQAGIKIARRNISKMTPPLWQKAKRN